MFGARTSDAILGLIEGLALQLRSGEWGRVKGTDAEIEFLCTQAQARFTLGTQSAGCLVGDACMSQWRFHSGNKAITKHRSFQLHAFMQTGVGQRMLLSIACGHARPSFAFS